MKYQGYVVRPEGLNSSQSRLTWLLNLDYGGTVPSTFVKMALLRLMAMPRSKGEEAAAWAAEGALGGVKKHREVAAAAAAAVVVEAAPTTTTTMTTMLEEENAKLKRELAALRAEKDEEIASLVEEKDRQISELRRRVGTARRDMS